MLAGESVPLFGDGTTSRDYTYIDDVIAGVRAAIDYQGSLYEVINLGNSRPVSLAELVRALEEVLGIQAKIERKPAQPGDVPRTWADITRARRLLGYEPKTELRTGLERFVAWLRAEIG